jgi:hypothetical protein
MSGVARAPFLAFSPLLSRPFRPKTLLPNRNFSSFSQPIFSPFSSFSRGGGGGGGGGGGWEPPYPSGRSFSSVPSPPRPAISCIFFFNLFAVHTFLLK